MDNSESLHRYNAAGIPTIFLQIFGIADKEVTVVTEGGAVLPQPLIAVAVGTEASPVELGDVGYKTGDMDGNQYIRGLSMSMAATVVITVPITRMAVAYFPAYNFLKNKKP